MIENGKKVSIEYTLKLEDGTVADTNVGAEPLIYEHGGNQILPALEQALEGMDVDQQKQVSLEAADGYGEHDPEGLREVEPDVVPEELREEGRLLAVTDPQGQQTPVTVRKVTDEKVVLDFNHPLAGEKLHFDVKIVGVD